LKLYLRYLDRLWQCDGDGLMELTLHRASRTKLDNLSERPITWNGGGEPSHGASLST